MCTRERFNSLTLDAVSLLKIEDGIFEVVATGGDTRLGGEDFDLAIVEHFCKQIHKIHGQKDIRSNERCAHRSDWV